MAADLSLYVGRCAVYLESRSMCVCTVDSVEQFADRVRVRFQSNPDARSCQLHSSLLAAVDPVAEPPFGLSWTVEASLREFFFEADFWQVSWLFGAGGIRVFFQPEFISRFIDGDVHWLVEFFDACEGDGDGNDTCG